MKLKMVLFALALVVSGKSLVAPAEAREAYFDQVICCSDDTDRDTSIVDLAGTQPTSLYNIRIVNNPALTTVTAKNVTSPPSHEMSFDVAYSGDDDTDGFEFRSGALVTQAGSTGGPVAFGAPGAVTIDPDNKFTAAISLEGLGGGSPPVVLAFHGQLAPGIAFDSSNGQPPIQRLLTPDGYSLVFKLASSGASGIARGQSLFASFAVSPDIVSAVPEPSVMLLATVGAVSAWQMGSPRRRVRLR